MSSKLTLRLDENLIERAKRVAGHSGKSVSQMVADYFSLLEAPDAGPPPANAPRTRALRGALRGAVVDEDDFRRHLEEKYR
ncbi:MAG: hypothetical protein KGZ83_03045 [Sulfuricella sp.]|nr:hypothetical protein [Sulfuricella sp.]